MQHQLTVGALLKGLLLKCLDSTGSSKILYINGFNDGIMMGEY
jgi:hypothetical protein